jgi:hypothetical protein
MDAEVPDDEDTTATAAFPEDHVPPVVAQFSVVALPLHIVVVPVITAGIAPTVTTFVLLQPVANVYEIVVVPFKTPLTVPVIDPTVATVVALLLHVPPVVALVSVIVEPAHTFATPAIVSGSAFTVATFTVVHPTNE